MALTVLRCLPPPLQVARCETAADCPPLHRCSPLHYCLPQAVDGGVAVEDGGVDAGVARPCQDDSSCDDGDPCNGVEACDLSRERCAPASLPWPGYHDGETCGVGRACLGGTCGARDPGCVLQLALGASHSCALGGDGQVRCWGRNHAGQLGDGSVEQHDRPTPVGGLDEVVAIGTGFDFSCALRGDGVVRCWGSNGFGQLGDGTRVSRLAPVEVSGLGAVRSLALGKFHACALQRDGQVRCWGHDENAQLGDAQQWTASSTPVAVPLTFAPVALAAGGYHTCALDAAGQVWCWGARWSGQTGTAVTPSNALQPTRIDGLAGVLRIAAGEGHTCAVRADQSLWCWGDDTLTHAGPDPTDRAAPAQVADLSEVVDVDTSLYHLCARLQRGGVKCWGFNREGQLGDGGRVARDTAGTTLQLRAGDPAVEVQAGGTHSCARLLSGAVWCWGDNTWGQLGEGSPQSSPSVAGVLISDVQEIRTGAYHTCVRLAGGTVACTGWNQRGQLGLGTNTDHDVPQALGSLDTVTALAAGPLHACAVRNSRALCWGANDMGQLGTGDYADRSSPQEVQGLSAVADLALGFSHSCALTHTGEVWCWGLNWHGELGVDDVPGSATPRQVALQAPAEQLSARVWTTCARLADNTAWCWGYNRDGQVGDSTLGSDDDYDGRALPRQVGIAGAVTDVSAGGDHGCGVDSTGQAWCWGAGSLGALGTGDRASSPSPVAVVDTGPVTDVESSWNNSCAIAADRTLWCWGANDAGELGNDRQTRDHPQQVLNLNQVAQVSTAELHTCALSAPGGSGTSALCWGQSAYGQLGNGVHSSTLVPVEVTALRCP